MSECSLSIADKVAIITGASSGIGKATACLFSKLGAKLALVGRNKGNLEDVGRECEKLADNKPLLIIVEDLKKDQDVQLVMKKTLACYQRVDILVNNAGSGSAGSIETTSMQQYDDIMGVNMRSVYHITMLAVPHLIKTKGTIVNVGSIAGWRGFTNFVAYSCAKGAIEQFTKCVALDLASKQVRCNSVCPGTVVTTFHERSSNKEMAEQYYEMAKSTHPMGRPCRPEEVANTIAFLASEQSSFITGTSIQIDGGRGAICASSLGMLKK